MGKALKSLDCRVDSKLSNIARKIDHLEIDRKDIVRDVEKAKAQVTLKRIDQLNKEQPLNG